MLSEEGYCTACCRSVEAFVPGGTGGNRPRARCPKCNALERHRFLAILLDHLAPYLHDGSRVLDVAPSRFITHRMRALQTKQHVRIDFDPEADSRAVDVSASLTHLPFQNAIFDLVVCYHVLEHIPDDAAAMREMRRVLTDGGLALVQVPFRNWTMTDEDPSAGPEERVARFGQADHVRWYGTDFDQRLAQAGMAGFRVQPPDVVGQSLVELCGLNEQENVWILRRASNSDAGVRTSAEFVLPSISGLGALAHDSLRTVRLQEQQRSMIVDLKNQLEDANSRERRAREDAEHWRERHERLRWHPAVDLLARLSRPARRATKQWKARSSR